MDIKSKTLGLAGFFQLKIGHPYVSSYIRDEQTWLPRKQKMWSTVSVAYSVRLSMKRRLRNQDTNVPFEHSNDNKDRFPKARTRPKSSPARDHALFGTQRWVCPEYIRPLRCTLSWPTSSRSRDISGKRDVFRRAKTLIAGYHDAQESNRIASATPHGSGSSLYNLRAAKRPSFWPGDSGFSL